MHCNRGKGVEKSANTSQGNVTDLLKSYTQFPSHQKYMVLATCTICSCQDTRNTCLFWQKKQCEAGIGMAGKGIRNQI